MGIEKPSSSSGLQNCFFSGFVIKKKKKPAAKQETQVWSLSQEDSLQKEMTIPVFLPGNAMNREVWQATVHGVAKETDTT